MGRHLRVVEAYGPHLVMDGYDCPPEILGDLEVVFNFLYHTPNLIKMTKIMPPYVFKYLAPKPEDWGVSGFVLIAESHLSIHTYPERGYFSLDIFSCKDFNCDDAVAATVKSFRPSRYDYKLLTRGLEFPHDRKLAQEVTIAQRLGKV